MTTGVRHVVLDRDGTLIRHIPYLSDPRQVELLPTVVEGLHLLRGAGCELFLHTNQSGVGRGMFTVDDVRACTDALIAEAGFGPDLFRRVCIATEAPTDVPVYRKPSPRFAREIMEEFGATPAELCYVGDNFSDLRAAEQAGCLGVGVDTGGHALGSPPPAAGLQQAHPIFERFIDAARYIVSGATNGQ